MNKQILISTTSFAVDDPEPLARLKGLQMTVVLNPYGRKLSGNEIVHLGKEVNGIIAGTETLTAEILKQLKSLKVISRCGVGMDNVDMAAAQTLGIKVFNTPTAPTTAVAELTLGLILNLLRQISSMDRAIRQGQWQKKMGGLLSGKAVGIVGYGQIGREVGRLCRALGARVCFYDTLSRNKKESGYLELSDLLTQSDILTLHLSYTKESHHLIGKKEISKMKKDSLLINCARGGLVDEVALHEALQAGKLGGAGLDVFENEPYEGPLRELENVILTPHIGSYAREARIQMEKEAVDNLVRGFEGL